MNVWNEPDNLFAPLIAAVSRNPVGGVRSLANRGSGLRAGDPPSIQHKGAGKVPSHQRDQTPRGLCLVGDKAKPFTALCALVDKGSDTPARGIIDTYWQMGLTHLKDGLCLPAVPPDYDTSILQCCLLRIREIGQGGAPQMALVRHLWAAAVLAASPHAIVFGGQHAWQDDWWVERVLEEPSPQDT
jgi:hypothetical protein